MNYDFGYTWPWTYGHLILAAVFALLALLLRRSRWAGLLLGGVAVWALAGFLVVQVAFGLNRPLPLPTERFLPSGAGRVLDVGCGSGRSTVMVGLARPAASVVGLDNFSADYIRNNGPELFRRNMRVAGIEGRTSVVSADMRSMPEPDASFDAVVSAYAIDHMPTAESVRALKEVARVLRKDGDFLLMLMRSDGWVKAAFGPFVAHGSPGPGKWRALLRDAGFEIREEGTSPATMYFLCRR
jgi:SAM-dependent methyltransferase